MMDLPEIEHQPDYIAIPEAFQSFATGKPFEHCICCEAYLLEDGTGYIIEKGIVQYLDAQVKDVAFEYAMCLPCVEKMRQRLSKDSLARMEAYFQERVDFAGRRNNLTQSGNRNVHDWLQHCLVSQTSMPETREYQIFAQCDGPDMLFGDAPYMLAGEVMAELQELLSPETKDVLDDFIDQHFGLPPAWKELVKDRSLFII
jgi:hypothetical protein